MDNSAFTSEEITGQKASANKRNDILQQVAVVDADAIAVAPNEILSPRKEPCKEYSPGDEDVDEKKTETNLSFKTDELTSPSDKTNQLAFPLTKIVQPSSPPDRNIQLATPSTETDAVAVSDTCFQKASFGKEDHLTNTQSKENKPGIDANNPIQTQDGWRAFFTAFFFTTTTFQNFGNARTLGIFFKQWKE